MNRRGPKQRYSFEDHQKVVDQVEALLERDREMTITSACTQLRITESRYQYARERVKLARSQGWLPARVDDSGVPIVHSEAYQPTRCVNCETARARSMWGGQALCAGCYEAKKSDWRGRAEVAKAEQAEAKEPEMERSSRVIPVLTNPEAEAADEQEVEESGEDENGVLDGMEVEFESDGDEPAPVDPVGQELVRVFVIEGSVDAVAAILERRFG